jgi:hypothetical protein
MPIEIGASLSDQAKGKMSQWGQISTGADGAFCRNEWHNATIEEVDQALDGLRANPRIASGECGDTE